MRAERRGAHRVHTGEVPVRPGGVLPVPVPEPAHQVREAAPAAAEPADGQLGGDRAAVLRAPGRQDADRDAHQGHAPLRQLLLLAVHVILETILGVLVKGGADTGGQRTTLLIVPPLRQLVRLCV